MMHIVIAGLLLQGVQMVSAAIALVEGVQVGVIALIISVQPVVISLYDALVLRERLKGLHWFGLALGAAGVAIVVWDKIAFQNVSLFGVGFAFLAMAGGAIGTVYQKKHCAAMDVWSGNALQLMAAGAVVAGLTLVAETGPVEFNASVALGLSWLILVVSFGATTLLFHLIRRGKASHVASLMYLMPPAAAGVAWIGFDEAPSWFTIIGGCVALLGAVLVRWRKIVPTPP